MRFDRCRPWLIVFFLGLVVARSGLAGEGGDSTTGAVAVGPGLLASYDYHFDRNAFAASVDAPCGLIALTRSGVLLRFDRESRKPGGLKFEATAATCLARGEGDSALVGFADGRIARLDPTTLALTVAILRSSRSGSGTFALDSMPMSGQRSRTTLVANLDHQYGVIAAPRVRGIDFQGRPGTLTDPKRRVRLGE